MSNEEPRQNAIVHFSDDCLPVEFRGQYPFKKDHNYIYMGEIPNMGGHCIVMDSIGGEVFTGFHIELFTEAEL